MYVAEITETALLEAEFTFEPVGDKSGRFRIIDPDGNEFGTVAKRDQARAGTIKLNRAVQSHGLGSQGFNRAVRQMMPGFLGTSPGIRMTPTQGNTNVPPGLRNRAMPQTRVAPGTSPFAGVRPGAAIANTAARYSRIALGAVRNSIVGSFIFGALAVNELSKWLDAFGDAYIEAGCNINDRRVRGYEMKIRRVLVEQLTLFGTGVLAATTGVIRIVTSFFAILPIGGWAAAALAWVATGVAASLISKLLSSTGIVNWIADYILSSFITAPLLRELSRAGNCTNESISPLMEENLQLYEQESQQRLARSAVRARDEIKQQMLNDPELRKVLAGTVKKIRKGEVEAPKV